MKYEAAASVPDGVEPLLSFYPAILRRGINTKLEKY
jgi:hypothetical protein